EQTLEAVLPRAYPLLERPRFDEMAQHDAASGDVALLVSRAACEDAPGRGLVHLVGLVEMRLVSGQEMGLQHPIDSDQALHGLARAFGLLDGVHESCEGGTRRRRNVRGRAKLGEPPAQRVSMLRIVPDVAAHQEL